MIVDDRLETVLRTVAAGPGAIRTQFRQLVDILGRTPAEGWSAAHVAALGRIDSLHAALGDAASGALIGSCTLRSPILVEHFVELGPKTALAAITSARLREAEWLQLIPDLPVQARGFLRHRRDLGPAVEALLARFGITDFALPLPPDYTAPAAQAPPRLVVVPTTAVPPTSSPPPAPSAASAASAPVRGEGIGAIVQRIEAFRRTRQLRAASAGTGAQPGAPFAPGTGQSRLPFVDEPAHTPPKVTAIDLRLDAEGMITAADAPYAAMLVGLRPFAGDPDAPAACNEASIRAARGRLPVDAGICTIEGTAAVAGTWRIDAAPLFAHDTGHFQGYHARLRRPPAAHALAAVNDDEGGDDAASVSNADRLRQMLHELRTPIGAIQGFAELIQQQLLGPTPHQYRSLAASIASDAARMLAGFEDIERLAGLEAKLEAVPHEADLREAELARTAPPGEADWAGLLRKLVQQLEPMLATRDIRLHCDIPAAPLLVPMEPLELERTLWRLLSFVTATSAPGERLALSLAQSPAARAGQAVLLLWLPAALAMRDDAALFAPDAGGTAAGAHQSGAMLGGGFALRLAAAEIRASGGALVRRGAQLEVTLPLLTAVHRTPSQDAGPAGQTG